jgi:hypothetical protein
MAIGMGIYTPSDEDTQSAGQRGASRLLAPIAAGFDAYHQVQDANKLKEDKKQIEYLLSEFKNPQSVIFGGKSLAERLEILADRLRPLDEKLADTYDIKARGQRLYERDESQFNQELQLKKDKVLADERVDLARLLAKAAENSDTKAIEQIWKDASRVLAEAIAKGNTPLVSKYTEIVSRAEKVLAGMRPNMWSDEAPELKKEGQEKTLGLEVKGMSIGGKPLGMSRADETTEEVKVDTDDPLSNAISEANIAIDEAFSKSVGKELVVGGKGALLTKVNNIATLHGINRADAKWKDVISKIENLSTDLKTAFDAEQEEVTRDLIVATKAEELAQMKYQNWLDDTLPGHINAVTKLRAVRDGLVSAMSQAKAAKTGGAYIAMKQVLGDALSNADFTGVAGFNISEGLLGMLRSLTGASPLTDDKAVTILRQAVEAFNTSLTTIAQTIDDSSGLPEYKKMAKGALVLPRLEFDLTTNTGEGMSTQAQSDTKVSLPRVYSELMKRLGISPDNYYRDKKGIWRLNKAEKGNPAGTKLEALK